ncbi:DNA polymerase I isoform X2 [Capsicum annuum]|uniref:DNA polymerase I isoform X2 n=1 Tax=Capsicum annuum TaxID=4072 RepID=UPI0007BF39A6|nr:DNA polymerase I isoform X2 [Capsicum annuum]
MEIQKARSTMTPRHFHSIPNYTHHLVLVCPQHTLIQQRNLRPLFCSHSVQPVVQDPVMQESFGKESHYYKNTRRKKRVFLLDVNPICYKGNVPSLQSFAHWISLFFSQVSLTDPVIAVVKIESHEADDVIATLVEQVLQRGHRVVVASPDKDFKQLISDDVQIVMPVPEFNRWSFYTLKHYVAQYNCDPMSDLSLRCLLGDEVDGVPGIQHVVPGFGRKTALKLLKKHGTLENLLNTAAVRSVGRQYAQDALIKYADYLRRNYEVLSLKRDVSVHIEEQWLNERDARNDSLVLSNFITSMKDSRNLNFQCRPHSNG